MIYIRTEGQPIKPGFNISFLQPGTLFMIVIHIPLFKFPKAYIGQSPVSCCIGVLRNQWFFGLRLRIRDWKTAAKCKKRFIGYIKLYRKPYILKTIATKEQLEDLGYI